MSKTHTEDDVRVIHETHAHDLDGHSTPSVCTLRYVGKAPTCDFHGTFRTIGDVHGLWGHAMSTAYFAELVEQLYSFLIPDGAILETLQLMLAVGWGEGGRSTLSISLISLSISRSGSCGNWKKEVIHGRSFPRCLSMSGTAEFFKQARISSTQGRALRSSRQHS
jgi:hypothetical protein